MIEIKFENNKSVAYDGNRKIGECNFVESENTWNITHTEVDSLYQGQGIARKLVESIIENAKNQDKELVAECFYAKKVISLR
ncbi:MAG: N-acetyltransferase [Clostridiales bacterium]|nr:N-acetyltransferase [Clostridiales bacterium]